MILALLALFIGFCSGFIGALSSGGGLISIPGLIFLGLSPSTAIATTRLSALSGAITSIIRFRKSQLIQFREVLPFLVLAVIGGLAGSKLLLGINEHLLSKSIGVLLLILLPILLVNKDFGTITKNRSRPYRVVGIFVVFLLMIYAAMFGGGGGVFLIYALVYFYGMTIIQANANGTVLGLVANLTAVIYYIGANKIDFVTGIPLLIGAAFGGYLGAHMAIDKGNAAVKWVFAIIIIVSSVKLLFFS